MNRVLTYCLGVASILSVAYLFGCSAERDAELQQSSDEVEFNYVIDEMWNGYGSVSSRAVVDEPTDLSQIKNMWIIKYSDTGYEGSDYDEDFDATESVKVEDDITTIVFLANTFAPDLEIPETATISDLNALTKDLTTDPPAHNAVLSDDGTDKYCVMSGILEDYSTTKGATVTLTRNCSKAIIKVVNNIEAGYALHQIETLNVPNISYFYPSYEEGATFPTSATYTESIEWSEEERANAVSEDGQTLYLPINRCGEGAADSSSGKSSPENAPANATAIRLTLRRTDGAWLRHYTFYLGANMTTDYNLTENYAYRYLFTIKSMGNPAYDPRITVTDLRDHFEIELKPYETITTDDEITTDDGVNVEIYDDYTPNDTI